MIKPKTIVVLVDRDGTLRANVENPSFEDMMTANFIAQLADDGLVEITKDRFADLPGEHVTMDMAWQRAEVVSRKGKWAW